MSCYVPVKVNIKEIAQENSKIGKIVASPGLTDDQIKAVLANIAKGINQAPDIISDGLGRYGLCRGRGNSKRMHTSLN